jgi:hypothetical protein
MHMHAKPIDEQVDTLHAVDRALPSRIPHHGVLLSMCELTGLVTSADALIPTSKRSAIHGVTLVREMGNY